MPSELPPEEMLQNLSGFFEGDGCVQSNLLELTMIRSFQGAEVLFPFQRYFGGSVGVNTAETGTESAVLQWSVSGARAPHLATSTARFAVCRASRPPNVENGQVRIWAY